MGFKNINISDEIYLRLSRLKLPSESFNSLLARLMDNSSVKNVGVDLEKYYGKWDLSDKEWKEIDKDLKNLWKTWKLP